MKPNKSNPSQGDFSLNEWIKDSKNQFKIINEMFGDNTNFRLKETQGIIDFRYIPSDIDDPENEHIQYIDKYYNPNDPEPLSCHRVPKTLALQKIYERQVNNYLITARLLDTFGITHNVSVCNVQGGYLRSQYNERIRKQVLAMPQHALPPEEIWGSWV